MEHQNMTRAEILAEIYFRDYAENPLPEVLPLLPSGVPKTMRYTLLDFLADTCGLLIIGFIFVLFFYVL